MLLLLTQCPGVGVDHEGGNRAEQGGDDEGAHGVRDMGARVVGQAHAHGRWFDVAVSSLKPAAGAKDTDDGCVRLWAGAELNQILTLPVKKKRSIAQRTGFTKP